MKKFDLFELTMAAVMIISVLGLVAVEIIEATQSPSDEVTQGEQP